MPQVKFSTSALGAYLAPKIKAFILSNANATVEDGSVDIGCEIKANAIAYGVALALSSQIFKSALMPAVVPPPVPPSTVTAGNPTLGITVANMLFSQTVEL